MRQLNPFVISLGLLVLISCSEPKEYFDFELKSEWKFRNANDSIWYTAVVPGCVHTDLISNRRIPDPFFQKNEIELEWIETADWEYLTSFDVSKELADFTNLEMQFLGLDTYADVYLNDSLVLKADNMFIAYEIPIKTNIKIGSNSLRVYFHSAVNLGMEKLRKVPYTLMAANEIAPENERSNVFTRKAPFHYGWDWGPRLVTCGIWRQIHILGWDKARMDNLYVKPVNISSEKAEYTAILDLIATNKVKASFEVWVEGKLASKGNTHSFEGKTVDSINFSIDNPEFWWTNGLGGQKLYNVEVRMLSGNKTIQSLSKRIGVRTIELSQKNDSIGTSFEFILNGVPVFMKGANYIPSDIFVTRNTLNNYNRVVDDALKANMNMLRIWGGAVYEGDEFYDLLDEKGILAWNDFMFACNLQPDDSLHLENIRKEAEYNVKRLRNHPSIALWCGNNENLRAWHDWKWKWKYSEEDAATIWKVYEKIFYQILPNAVAEFHPEVSYWPSSPQAAGNKLSNRISGDEHDWSVWFGDVPFSAYAENVPRFVSEYGLQAFPEMKTIRAFAVENDLSYRSPVMEHRQRSQMPWIAPGFNGNEMINRYISRYYKSPENFESFVYLSQIVQAEGVKFAVETHRRNRPRCMGSLYWQINDCWPTMSWSSVDYFGRWKALHYFVKNAFQPVYPIIYREGKNINVSVASDKLKPENIRIEAKLYDFAGKILWQKNIDTLLAANTSGVYMSVVEDELLTKGMASQSVFEIIIKAENQILSENLFYFIDCKNLKFEYPGIERTIVTTGENEYEISLTTKKLAKNVALFTSAEIGSFSENYFDMIPGRIYKVNFKGVINDLESDMFIKTVNEL